jgi:hypothetical protein
MFSNVRGTSIFPRTTFPDTVTNVLSLTRNRNRRRQPCRKQEPYHDFHRSHLLRLEPAERPLVISPSGSDAGLHEATAAPEAEEVRTILEIAMIRLFRPKILHLLEPHAPKLAGEG